MINSKRRYIGAMRVGQSCSGPSERQWVSILMTPLRSDLYSARRSQGQLPRDLQLQQLQGILVLALASLTASTPATLSCEHGQVRLTRSAKSVLA